MGLQPVTIPNEVDLSKAKLLFSDSWGIYIPQQFAQTVRREYVKGVSDEDYKILEAGPDHEHYWDAWADVCDNAAIEQDGVLYHLHQDGDLWLVPVEQEEEKPPTIKRFGHTFRPMTGDDWEGYAGAEDGSYIYDGEDCVLILSPDGKCLSEFNADGLETMWSVDVVFG